MKNETSRERSIERLLREPLRTGAASVRGVCLDVDTLAAWADDDLGPEERAAAESHVADCGRCQALIAAMVKTSVSPAKTPAWWRRPSLAWLVPITAVTAALIIWIAIPTGPRPGVDTVGFADSRGSQQAQAKTPAEPPPLSTGDITSRDKAESAPREAARIAEAQQSGQDSLRGVDKFDVRAQRAKPAAGERREDEAKQKALGELTAANEVARTPPAAAPMAKSMIGRAAPAIEIVSSNPGSRWRIVGNGAVERSMDGGSTWQQQQTGVNVALTAGTSPSPSVCWLVGAAGTVLLSTDGRSWRRVAFPEAADLIAVRATDAQSATVTTADGRTFSTSDGGQTWQAGV